MRRRPVSADFTVTDNPDGAGAYAATAIAIFAPGVTLSASDILVLRP